MEISVIIASHNTGKYIRKCLDSVLNQTMKDYEVIIVDDASTDDTPQIIMELSQQYSNIIFQQLEESNGPGNARNIALSMAQGKYIAFVDSDDWIDLNYLQIMHEKAKTTNADIIACGLIREYDYQSKYPVYKCRYDQEFALSGEIAFRIMTGEYDYGINYISSSLNKLFNKQFLQENSLRFAEDIYFEDQPFSYSCTLAAKKIICVPGTLYHHYKRTGSIVQSFNIKNIDDMMTAYKIIKEYLNNHHIYEQFRFNYYSSLQHFYNLLIRQIFEFVISEDEKKQYIKYSFAKIKEIIDINEYLDYVTAEELRRHIQPEIDVTTIY